MEPATPTIRKLTGGIKVSPEAPRQPRVKSSSVETEKSFDLTGYFTRRKFSCFSLLPLNNT
jgi:hypothetical protein